MMPSLLIHQDSRLIAWAANVLGFTPDGEDMKAIGWGDETRIRAVALFERFTRHECWVHLASDGSKHWMTRTMLHACFGYPFVQLGLNRMTGVVPAKNADAIKLNLHLGWKIEGRCREALGDDDVIVMGMLRRECRYIPEEFRI